LKQYTGKRFCGVNKPPNFVSSSSSVTITFHSDATVVKSGFAIQWITEGRNIFYIADETLLLFTVRKIIFSVRCSSSEFTCWDGTCISLSQYCDGIKNCSDDSDEIECSEYFFRNKGTALPITVDQGWPTCL